MAFSISTKSAFLIAAERAQAEREAQAKRETKRVCSHKHIDHQSQYKFKALTMVFFREQRIQQASLRRKQLREEEFTRHREELAQIEAERIEAMRIEEEERIESERLANAVVPMLLPIVRHNGGYAANVAGFEFEERVRGSILAQNGIIHSHFKVFSETTHRDLTDIDAYVPFCITDNVLHPVIVEMKVTVGWHACSSIPQQVETQLRLFPDACVVVYTEDTLNLDRLRENMHLHLDVNFRGRWIIASEPTQLLGLLRQEAVACHLQPEAVQPNTPDDIVLRGFSFFIE